MKRLPLLVLVALGGVALGAGAATKLNTYSYVPDALNAPCGKTMLEWNLMAGRIEAEPVSVSRDYELVRLVAEPKPEGIIVRAYVRLRDAKTPATDTAAQWVDRLMRQRFGLGMMKQRLYLLTHVDDRLVDIRGNDKAHPLAPNATREEQLAALATIMSHATPP